MNTNPESSAQMDFETARIESKIIADSIRTYSEPALKSHFASDPKTQVYADKFGDTAYIEFASQELGQIKENHPHLYKALLERQESFDNLAASLYPEHLKISHEKHEAAYESARLVALSLVDRVAQVLSYKDPVRPGEEYRLSLDEVLKITDKQVGISIYNTVGVGSLVSAAVASFHIKRLTPRGTPPWTMNLDRAIGKH